MSKIANAVMKGSVLVFLSGIFIRLISFVCQIILGWKLSKTEFGLYGAVISATSIFACFQDSGVGKLLVQQSSKDFGRYVRPAIALSVGMNIIIASCFIVSGYFYGRKIGNDQVTGMMIVLAISSLLGMSLIVSRSALLRELQFKQITKIDTVSNVLSQVLMLPLAFLGAGPYSFVVPTVAAKIYQNVSLRKVSPVADNYLQYRFWKQINRTDLIFLLKGMPWLMLSALAMALIQRGDYLILGLKTSPEILGVYFFGFQLTVALSSFLTTPISQIFMPALSKLNDEPVRQMSAYFKSISAISLLSYPICFGGILVAGWGVNQIWGGKWNEAIEVVQLLLLVLPMRFLSPVGRALLEARGKWRLSAGLLVVDGIGTCLSAYLGTLGNGLTDIVIYVAVWRFLVGALQVLVVPIFCSSGLAETLSTFVKLFGIVIKFILVAVFTLITCLILTKFEPIFNYGLLATFKSLATFLSMYLLFAVTFFRLETKSLLELIRRR